MWYIFVSVSSFFSYCHNLKSIDVLTDISAFNVLKYILSIVAALDQIIDNVYHVGILLTFTNSENKVGYILEPIKGVLHPRPVFGLFLHFSQKLQHIGNK